MPKKTQKEAFQELECELHDVLCVLACAAAAVDNADEVLAARADSTVRQCVSRLQTLHEAMDRFNLEHLPEPKLQAVRS